MAHDAVPTMPLRTLALDPGTREMGYKDLRTREKDWQSMFDAVALGLTGYEDVSRTWVPLQVVTQHRDKNV